MTVRQKLRVTLTQSFGSSMLEERLVDGTEPSGADSLPSEGDVVGGHYRLVERIGEGMFGCVYVAERTDVPEHRVALKMIDRSVYAGRDVARELVMLAAVTHPNIVQLKDHGMTADYVWLTMPLYAGETLDERLERGPLTLREAYEVFLPITRGVHALHQRGLRHQDIKPENIFLADIGGAMLPVLLDLGVAVESSSAFVAGTALYGSPEQIAQLGGLEEEAALSDKIDTYCLAATLLRALVGPDEFPGERASSPFDLATAFEDREKSPLAEEVLPGLSGEPRAKLERALSRWLTRDPAARPHTGELAHALDVLLEQEREAAAAIEHEISQQKTSLKRVRIALAAAALVGGAVVLWGVAHRETLRLARELEHARAVGADSFDKLDTCVAAHRIAERDASACGVVRQREAREHETTVTRLKGAHAHASQALEERIGHASKRHRVCVDERRRATTAWDQERTTLETAVSERDAAMVVARADHATVARERDDARAGRASCELELTAQSTAANTCTQELQVCVADKDSLAQALAARPVAPPPPTHQAPGSVPGDGELEDPPERAPDPPPAATPGDVGRGESPRDEG